MKTLKASIINEEGNKEKQSVLKQKNKLSKFNAYLSKISNNLGLCHLAMIK